MNSQKNPESSSEDEGARLSFSMRPFVPNQAIIYNYFQIMKDYGFIQEVQVYKDSRRNRYHIGVLSNESLKAETKI